MARTDKDAPWEIRFERGEIGHSGIWPGTSSNWRKCKRELKRIGHKNVRNGKKKFYDVKTVRTAVYYQ